MQDLTALIELLGEDNVQRLKDTITNELIENLTECIQYEYIIPPDELQEMFADLRYEIAEKLKKKYTKVLTTELSKKIDKMVEKTVK